MADPRLRTPCKLQLRGETDDGTESYSDSFTDVADPVYAQIRALVGLAFNQGKQTEDGPTHEITVRFRADAYANPVAWDHLLVKADNRRFRVLGRRDETEARRFLVLDAELLTGTS